MLHTNGKLDFLQIKKVTSLYGLNTDNLKDINATVDLKTNINFDLNKRFKVKNLSYSTEGNITHIEIHAGQKRIIKKYLPEFDPRITLKDTSIKLVNSKSDHTLELGWFYKSQRAF